MQRRRAGVQFILCALMLLFPLFNNARSQQPVEPTPPGDLVPIDFELKRVGRIEILSIQRENKVYLAARMVLDFLKIKNDYIPSTGVLSGFFVTPDTPYVVETRELKAKVGKRSVSFLPNDLIVRGDSLYLRVELFDLLFGLPVTYNPRALKATLFTHVPLPVFLASRLKHLEATLAAQPPRLKPDATFERPFSIINGGQLDYSLRQTLSPDVLPRRSFSTRLTGTLVGGDAELRFLGSLSSAVNFTQTRARWRYVPTRLKLVRQFIVGDFISTGLLAREMYGLQITNVQANPRIFFSDEQLVGKRETKAGTYLFEGFQLSQIDRYKNTDYYSLSTRLKYGVNYIDITEFGEWGETFGFSRRIIVPATLVPPGQVDYDIKVGRTRDRFDPWHGAFSTSWGISSRVTAGIRSEYYDIENLPTKVFPEANLTTRLTDYLMGEAVLSPNAQLRGSLEFTLPSLVGASLSYTEFRDVRLFNPRRAINQITGFVNLPFSVNGGRFAFDATATQTILIPSRERKLGLGVSAFIGLFSPRITTRYGWNYVYGPNVTDLAFHETEPSIRARLPQNVFLSVSAPYNHMAGMVRNLRIGVVVQPLSGLQLEFQFDRNFAVKNSIASLRLQYTAPFTRATVGAVRSGESYLYDQSISGSVGVVPELGEFFFDNNPSRAGYGSMLVAPFVDANMNGVRDEGEEIISVARLRASAIDQGGFKLSRFGDVGWIVPRAIPYQDYLIEMSQRDLENPLWVPRYKVVQSAAPPGAFSLVSIPIIPGGAIRGTIQMLRSQQEQAGVEFVKVAIREMVEDEDLTRLGRSRFQRTVESFSNGDFELVGVPPGNYTVSLDDNQLARMQLQGRQLSRTITVAAKPDGDVVEGVNFILLERRLMFQGGRYK